MANALKYDEGNKAPEVIAQGQGVIANKILSIAKENKIPVYKDENLANQLKQLEIGQEIPQDLYEVVAEVLVYISKFDK